MGSFYTPYAWHGGGVKQILAGGSGRLEAYKALTGDPVWHVTGLPVVVCPSPAAADGMIVFGGWTTAHVAGEPLCATPAVVENTLYVRGGQHLWAFGG